MAGLAGSVMAVDLVDQLDRGRWLLPLTGEPIMSCCVDYAFSFGTGNLISIRIEQPFVYTSADGAEHLIVPEGDPVQVAPALVIARLSVREGFAFADGHLELTFSDGSMIGVPSAEGYEPWDLTGPDGLKVVSVPGGELAIWRPSAPSP